MTKTRMGALLGTAVLAAGGLVVTAGTASAAPTVTKLSHSDAASRFRGAGITWSSSGGCSDRYNSTCTSFEQINLDTVNGAITLKTASGCGINITGGTETGHASGTYSHWNGYKVDMSKTSCITNYVHSRFTYIGQRGDGAALYRSGAGNIYADEGNHWDVLYYNCGGC